MSNRPTASLKEIVESLHATGFRDIAGATLAADVPISEELLDRVIASTLPAQAPVRAVTVRPEPGDHLSVRIVPKAGFIPAMTLKLLIETQPDLPASPTLTLRMMTLGGLFGLASGAIAGWLPPGIHLDGDRIRVDLATLARARGAAELFQYLTKLQVHTDDRRLLVSIRVLIGAPLS